MEKETKKKYVSNVPNIKLSELKKMFPYVTEKELKRMMQENEWIKLDKFLAEVRKVNDGYKLRAERPDVKELHLSITWKRSRTWGHNPHLYWEAYLADGTWTSGRCTCSGCGYDKESTVVAEACNEVLSGMLWRKRNKKGETPYGIYRGKDWYFPRFEGGVGMSCYYSIIAFLGGKLKRTATGDDYDKYVATFAKAKRKAA